MRLIDADELMEHVWRDRLDSRELIATMVNTAPTIEMCTPEKCLLIKKLTADFFQKYVKGSDKE